MHFGQTLEWGWGDKDGTQVGLGPHLGLQLGPLA